MLADYKEPRTGQGAVAEPAPGLGLERGVSEGPLSPGPLDPLSGHVKGKFIHHI